MRTWSPIMRIAEVFGTVTLNRCHPSFQGARLRLAQPLSLANLAGEEAPQADPIVVWDEMGAGLGSRIAMSEGPEAAQPFRPELKPVDAYNAAILDELDLHIGPAES
jgi:ethanolamine utilization protein EutN